MTLPPLPRPTHDQVLERTFWPADGMDEFVRAHFLNPDSPLFIEEHEVLSMARIGYLWATPEARDRGRTIIGTAQLVRPPQKKWGSLRSHHQVLGWFGTIDFLITLSAAWVVEQATDAEALALLDHELSHCRQAQGEFEDELWHEDGTPVWEIVGHDVEEHVGVVARWGARATRTEALVAAATQPALFADVDLAGLVGGCGTRAAKAA